MSINLARIGLKNLNQLKGHLHHVYDLQEFYATEMFNANARRSMLKYGEETRTHLEDGGTFEDYYVEDWKCG